MGADRPASAAGGLIAMLYHTSLCVADVPRAAAFYDAMLAPLGMRRIWDLLPQAVGFGRERGEFWLQSPEHQPFLNITRNAHFAFGCTTAGQVAAVHDAAVAAGGRSVTPPSAHPEIGADYFAAIVEDPDGHMVEIMRLRTPAAG
ncbi:VOC family protein [Sphingomonas canadensis]|uniref:VOC family protein n=1 Tax=Sphingomonas canadensis TaxID=1219257 RepID=A0ABW3HB07_9SPHN|nr:VOC family protein [Sphingomonas canadensis]MCW3836987.1 VOC family protein [Sphingomonas canadensis]